VKASTRHGYLFADPSHRGIRKTPGVEEFQRFVLRLGLFFPPNTSLAIPLPPLELMVDSENSFFGQHAGRGFSFSRISGREPRGKLTDLPSQTS